MPTNTQIYGKWRRSRAAGQVSDTPDLRRRNAREAMERITYRSQWLPEPDRQLLIAIYNDGKRINEVAALSNVPSRALQARIRKLVTRVSSELFQFVALYHESWPTGLRHVADACIFRGLSVREASALLGTSYHNVRRQLELVRFMHRAHLAPESLVPHARYTPRTRPPTPLAVPGSCEKSLPVHTSATRDDEDSPVVHDRDDEPDNGADDPFET